MSPPQGRRVSDVQINPGALADILASSTELDDDHYGRVSTRSNAKANFFFGRFRRLRATTIISTEEFDPGSD